MKQRVLQSAEKWSFWKESCLGIQGKIPWLTFPCEYTFRHSTENLSNVKASLSLNLAVHYRDIWHLGRICISGSEVKSYSERGLQQATAQDRVYWTYKANRISVLDSLYGIAIPAPRLSCSEWKCHKQYWSIILHATAYYATRCQFARWLKGMSSTIHKILTVRSKCVRREKSHKQSKVVYL